MSESNERAIAADTAAWNLIVWMARKHADGTITSEDLVERLTLELDAGGHVPTTLSLVANAAALLRVYAERMDLTLEDAIGEFTDRSVLARLDLDLEDPDE